MAARLRAAAIVAIGSGIAGALVGGLGSRLVMRLAALAAPEVRGAVTENGTVVGEITLDGNVALMVFAGVASTASSEPAPSSWRGPGSPDGPSRAGWSSAGSCWR